MHGAGGGLMAPGLFAFLASLALVVGGAFGVYRGWHQRAERQVIRSTPTTDVLSITPGPVEVVGTARPTEEGPLRAPFSEDDCLIAEWEITEYEEAGKHSSWNTVGRGVVSTPFFVDDGTDAALVRPEGVRLDVEETAERTIEVPTTEDPPEPVQAFLELDTTPGQADEPLLPGLDWGQMTGDRRYTQHLVRPDETVYVHGTATRAGAEEFGGHDFEIGASASDGHAEADLFLISDRSEEDLLASRRFARLYLVGGAIAILAGTVGLTVSVVGL